MTEVENDHLFHLKVKQIEKEKEYEKNHWWFLEKFGEKREDAKKAAKKQVKWSER